MFGSLFGKRKKKKSDFKPSVLDDGSIRSARIDDVVVITAFSPSSEDAYLIVEKIDRYESAFGKWYEITAAEGERQVAITWSDDDGISITVSEQDEPMGLGAVGIEYDDLVRLDNEQSIENYVTYEGENYFYKNSYEVYYFKDSRGEGDGFYLWEFGNNDHDKALSVIKWEGMPFEVYTSKGVSEHLVSVYKK